MEQVFKKEEPLIEMQVSKTLTYFVLLQLGIRVLSTPSSMLVIRSPDQDIMIK
jgi:hypothetical protein